MGRAVKSIAWTLALLAVGACAGDKTPDTVDPFTGDQASNTQSILGLFSSYEDPNVTVEVNRYIWDATLEVLAFMPVKAADPFTGVIVFDYGTPPGGSTAYRATAQIKDPSLDARSLNLSLLTRSGPAAPDTVRSVEDAILTRARQLRIGAERL